MPVKKGGQNPGQFEWLMCIWILWISIALSLSSIMNTRFHLWVGGILILIAMAFLRLSRYAKEPAPHT
jgi:hypothetical protein